MVVLLATSSLPYKVELSDIQGRTKSSTGFVSAVSTELGQTSWGPTIFAFAPTDTAAEEAAAQLQSSRDVSIVTSRFRNQGSHPAGGSLKD